MLIRPIEEGDLPALRDLLETFTAEDNVFVDSWLDGWPQERERGVVALDDADIVGACWFRETFDETDIPEMLAVVRPDSRGKGVGRSLVKANIAQAVELGLKGMLVAIRKDNPVALRLLEEFLEGYNVGYRYETAEEINLLVLADPDVSLPDALKFFRVGPTRPWRYYLENGRIVPVTQVQPGEFGIGECHHNSRFLTEQQPDVYEWWSGYAIGPEPSIQFHSWVKHVESGNFIEVTWPKPGKLYIGAPR